MNKINKQQTPEIIDVISADQKLDLRIDNLLDDSRQTRVLRRSLFLVGLLVMVLIIWASLVQVDELARARGEVQPGEGVQSLQVEEGGTVVKLLVQEGDSVNIGQPLVEFAATGLHREIEQNEVKRTAAMIDRERLGALLENRALDLTAYDKYPLLVQHGLTTYQLQLAQREALLDAKLSAIEQQKRQIQGMEYEKDLLESELIESTNRLARLEEGVRKGLVNKLMPSEVRQQVLAVKERQSELRSRHTGALEQIRTLEAERRSLEAEFNENLSIELSKATQLWRELQAEERALVRRSERFEIKSPFDGVVMNLPQTKQNAVIMPGGVVADIVPANQDVVMEVMVMPRDIGFVRIGQSAAVKFDSFDYSRFGSVPGKVSRVSPTSFKTKENGSNFYKVQIALDHAYVGVAERKVIAGMTGEADIATGRKSVIQYLLKPIFLTADTAFHER